MFGPGLSGRPVPGSWHCKDRRRGEGCPSSGGGKGLTSRVEESGGAARHVPHAAQRDGQGDRAPHRATLNQGGGTMLCTFPPGTRHPHSGLRDEMQEKQLTTWRREAAFPSGFSSELVSSRRKSPLKGSAISKILEFKSRDRNLSSDFAF